MAGLKVGFAALVFFGGLFFVTTTVLGSKVKVDEPFELAQDFSGQAIKVEWRNGPITVQVSDAVSRLVAKGTKTAQARDEARANQLLDSFEIVIEESAGEAAVLVMRMDVPKTGMNENVGASLDLTIPAGTALDLHTSNGTVAVEGNNAATKIKTSNGKIRVVRQSGAIDAKSSNGEISIDTDAGAIHADTSNGTIDIVAASAGIPEIVASTSNGRIKLQLPCGVGANVSAKTSNGKVRIAMADVVDKKSDKRSRFEGTINGGGMPIELKSSNGAIAITCEKDVE